MQLFATFDCYVMHTNYMNVKLILYKKIYISASQRYIVILHFYDALAKPEAPTNCSLYNVSASSLTVACMPGFDGGLNQTFAMEVYGTSPHSLKANITNNHPR